VQGAGLPQAGKQPAGFEVEPRIYQNSMKGICNKEHIILSQKKSGKRAKKKGDNKKAVVKAKHMKPKKT